MDWEWQNNSRQDVGWNGARSDPSFNCLGFEDQAGKHDTGLIGLYALEDRFSLLSFCCKEVS